MAPYAPHRGRTDVETDLRDEPTVYEEWDTLLALVTALLGAACSERGPVAPATPAHSRAAVAANAKTTRPVIDRFDIDVRATGSFRPGTPVTLDINITALIPTEDVVMEVHLPEVEAARRTAWSDGFEYLVDERVPAAASLTRRSLGRGGVMREQMSITVPSPGYYRVVVTARPSSRLPASWNGNWVRNEKVAETWLLIRDVGGGHEATFNERLIPSGNMRAPGPFRSRSGGQQQPDGSDYYLSPETHGPSASARNSVMSSMTSISVRALYYNADVATYQPIPWALVQLYTCSRPPEQFICDAEDFQLANSGATDENGTFAFNCDGDEYRAEISTYRGNVVVVENGLTWKEGSVDDDCGNSYDLVIGASAQIFINMHKTDSLANIMFNAYRSIVEVAIDASEGTSYYDTGSDEIVIHPNDVWGEWGIFVAAHEYGHAYHAEALYGTLVGCGQHFLDTETSLPCAYTEGFADYFGAAVRSDLAIYDMRSHIEANVNFPGCAHRQSTYPYTCTGGISTEGSIIEGAIAAFLYDLTDSVVESHDSIAAPGTYMRDLIRTCQVRYSSTWFAASGVDELTYCAENAVNPGSYFTVRGFFPDLQSEAATESGGWTSGRVNKSWRYNLYEKT